ncbi:MAG: hypothetical protein NVSMB38_34730 [Ktedonobacteraceae bacterium]
MRTVARPRSLLLSVAETMNISSCNGMQALRLPTYSPVVLESRYLQTYKLAIYTSIAFDFPPSRIGGIYDV